jgi:hypothetical protein
MSDTPSQLLDKFGLVLRADLAALLGVTEKALTNRPRSKLPSRVVRIGNRTFYTVDSVQEFLDRHTVTTDV